MTTTQQRALRHFTAAEMEAMAACDIVPEGTSAGGDAGLRFTVDEYLALGAAGILTKEERVELLDGEIIQMAPIGNRHQHSIDWLADCCMRLLDSGP